MKTTISKIALILLMGFSFMMAAPTVANAQVFKSNKMPVGVKYYEVEIVDPETEVVKKFVFADVEGQYDVMNFKNLDTSLAVQKRSLVYDPKMKTWRLPLNSELSGIPNEKTGPLIEQYFILGNVQPSLRHRVE